MQILGEEVTTEVSARKRPHNVAELYDSSAASPGVPSSSTQKSWVRHSYFSYILFTLCAAAYLLPFVRVLWTATDEGTLAYGAVRVVHGQVFARDFFEVMGPGTFYWLAAFFKLLGVSFFAERACLFVTSLGTFLLMYLLSRRVCRRYQFLPPILLVGVYFGTQWPMVNHHVDSNFFGLLAVVCMVLWQNKRKAILLIAAGAWAAVTTCILQPKGMLLLLAFLAWLWFQQRRRPALLSSLFLVAAGYFGVIALTALYFWSQGALRDLVYVNLVWPYQNYGAVNAVPYAQGLLQYWTHWISAFHGAHWLTPLAAVLFVPFLLVAALPPLVLVLGIPLRTDNLKPDILLYWLCGWALWLSEIHRRDIAHLVFGSALLIILCVHFLAEYRTKVAALTLQLLSVSAAALATINLFIVLSAHTVQTRVGSMAVFKQDPVLSFLDTRAAPGTDIFVYPYCPMYYFLSATTNPTRYSLLMYNYNTPSQFRDTVGDLEKHKVPYVVWDRMFNISAVAANFAPSARPPSGALIIEPYLESHYRVIKQLGGMQILERKTDNPADPR